MESGVKIALIISIAVIAAALIGAVTFYNLVHPYDNEKTITVEGNSVIKVTPDIVSVYFNVETNGSTAKEAKDANSEIVDDLITALVKNGFDREDVETMSLNIYEDIRWEKDRQKSYGYKASHQIRVVLDSNRADDIGEVIDAGVDAGALLGYINFELSNDKQNEYKATALKEAGEDAKVQAESLASGLGKKLGSIKSVSTNNFNYRPWNVYTSNYGGMMEDVSAAKVATTNIVPGSQEVTGYVRVIYNLR
jgi:uncharacterized protein YggE